MEAPYQFGMARSPNFNERIRRLGAWLTSGSIADNPQPESLSGDCLPGPTTGLGSVPARGIGCSGRAPRG